MKIEYDPARDLLYSWFGTPGEKLAKTETVVPGVYADFDRNGRLLVWKFWMLPKCFGIRFSLR